MIKTVVFRKAVSLEGKGGYDDDPFAQGITAGAWGTDSKAHVKTVLLNVASEPAVRLLRESILRRICRQHVSRCASQVWNWDCSHGRCGP